MGTITFKQGIGIGRWFVLVDGVQVGQVIRLRRYGAISWKAIGSNRYFGSRNQAALELVSALRPQ